MSATPAPEPREPWHEANPDRLQWELDQFAEVGLPTSHEVDEHGTLSVTTELSFQGEKVELRVEYPFDFPDVEPTVYGPPLLDRHQNRRQGNFCLLDLPAVNWWPSMSAAHLVDEDLRSLLRDSEAGADAVAGGEADMPEPLSQHIAADTTRPVIVPDPFWELDLGADGGEIVLAENRLGSGHTLIVADGLGSPSEEIIDVMVGSKADRHKGRWAALDEGAIPPWPARKELLGAIEEARPDVFDRLKKTLKRDRKRREVEGWVGLTFREEGPRRGQWRRGWVFLLVRMTRDGKRKVRRTCRALAFNPAERSRRIPELAGLDRARIAVFGAGSIGAPLALELAKAGVGELDIVDYDRYEVNNAVRHVLDPRWAGSSKAIAVSIEAESMNPFIKVRNHDLYVGGRDSDVDRVAALVAEADLVIDATGSQSAARILQRRCRESGKALVLASLTAGSFGGEVAVLRPNGPCFSCFALGQLDGSVPAPLEGPRSNTTPVGCSTPAFSGAGFDATALAALAARTAVRATGLSEYPELDYDYVVVNFRGPDPWRQGHLETHPNCPICT